LWVTKEKVYLSGFFEISKILKAFVYANEIVTKVGTSFKIKA
jgi:hypothetical protein